MSELLYTKDPFASDSLTVHSFALLQKKNDSLRVAAKIDSIRDSKILHLEKINAECYDQQIKHEQVLRPSVFGKHLLHPTSLVPEKSRNTSPDWILVVILFVLLLLGAVRQLNNKRLLSFISAFFASRFAGQLQREEYAVNNRTTAALLVSFVLVFSLFIFRLLEVAGVQVPGMNTFVQYLLICGAVTGTYLVKIIAVRLMAFVFKAENEATAYIFYILLFNQLLGIILLPVVLGLVFIHIFDPKYLLYSGLIIFSIFFIYRILRGVLLSVSKPGISRFYLFLYLCTLEFLPVLFAIKYLSTF